MSAIKVPKTIRICFGLFMICLYLAMGIAVLMDVFVMAAPWMRYVLGPLLIAYGIFRAYRQIRLRDYSRYDDDSDDSQSATAHYDDTDK